MADTNDLLAREYEAINAHLRANIGQFVNWFSFFLTFSFVALAVFVATGDRWPQPRLLRLEYAVPAVFLLMHLLAFVAILTFRHYIAEADRRVGEIVAEAPDRRGDRAVADPRPLLQVDDRPDGRRVPGLLLRVAAAALRPLSGHPETTKPMTGDSPHIRHWVLSHPIRCSRAAGPRAPPTRRGCGYAPGGRT